MGVVVIVIKLFVLFIFLSEQRVNILLRVRSTTARTFRLTSASLVKYFVEGPLLLDKAGKVEFLVCSNIRLE